MAAASLRPVCISVPVPSRGSAAAQGQLQVRGCLGCQRARIEAAWTGALCLCSVRATGNGPWSALRALGHVRRESGAGRVVVRVLRQGGCAFSSGKRGTEVQEPSPNAIDHSSSPGSSAVSTKSPIETFLIQPGAMALVEGPRSGAGAHQVGRNRRPTAQIAAAGAWRVSRTAGPPRQQTESTEGGEHGRLSTMPGTPP